MPVSDIAFAGSIPALYDRCLGPLQFEPFAIDLAERIAKFSPKSVLETAAGTGIVTVELVKQLGASVTIHATDLNQPMLTIAAPKISSPNVFWQQADAQTLPFGDAEFDVLACQFGVMFFPDKLKAYQEAYRVLAPGGHFVFNVWDRLELNAFSDVVDQAVAACFPDNAPQFFRRMPFGYFDTDTITGTLREAGFERITFEHVAKKSQGRTAEEVAFGLCQGTPLRGEIETRDPQGLDKVTAQAASALKKRFGQGAIECSIQAIVFDAQRLA